MSIRPVPDAPVSKGHLCVKGRYAFDFVTAADRVTEPMIREADAMATGLLGRGDRGSWPTRLRAIVARHGPDSVGVLGSARATNEDNYVAQKFARVAIGTNNVDCCARVCHAPSAAGLKLMLGAGLATNSFDDIELARTILVCGANPTENHPIVGARIRQAARRGTRLIVIDPRRIELAADADCHLAIRPGTNVAAAQRDGPRHPRRGPGRRSVSREPGRRAARSSRSRSRAWTPDRAAEICGVEADGDSPRRTALRDGRAGDDRPRPGFTEHVQGTDGVMALINLALLTGNIGRPGAGVNPLRGQNNVQGAAHMGCEPGTLAGIAPLDPGRGCVRGASGALRCRHRAGSTCWQMMDAAIAGRFKALWAIGYDVLLTNPNARRDRAGRSAHSSCVIVQDLFLTETARDFGTRVPAGVLVVREGRHVHERRAPHPARPGSGASGRRGAKPDWQILCDVARGDGLPRLRVQRARSRSGTRCARCAPAPAA